MAPRWLEAARLASCSAGSRSSVSRAGEEGATRCEEEAAFIQCEWPHCKTGCSSSEFRRRPPR